MFVDADGMGEVEHRFASDFYFDLLLRYTGSLLLTLIPVVAEGVQCSDGIDPYVQLRWHVTILLEFIGTQSELLKFCAYSGWHSRIVASSCAGGNG